MSQIDERTPTDLIEIDAEDDNALRVIVVVPWEWAGPFSTGHLAGCASR